MSLITREEFDVLPLGLKRELKEKMGDAGIQAFLDTATTQVENFCDRQLELGAVVQELDGNGQLQFLLREFPVASITSVTWEDEVGMTGTEAASLFRCTSSGILRWKDPTNGPFWLGRLYTITYQAGYATIPGPIKHATALWATELMQPAFNQGVQGKPTALIELSSEQIGELLEQYRRKGPR